MRFKTNYACGELGAFSSFVDLITPSAGTGFAVLDVNNIPGAIVGWDPTW